MSEKIFSGKGSKGLWKAINKTAKATPYAHDALYLLGCRCQELEAVIVKMQAQIDALQKEPQP